MDRAIMPSTPLYVRVLQYPMIRGQAGTQYLP